MASTAGQTVRVHLAASCLPCITLGRAPTSRHTQSSTQTAFPTMAIQRDVFFVKATKIELFFGRLSRAGLFKSIWTAHLPTQQTTALGPRRAGSSFQSVDSSVPQRAHEFVSIQLAVPRARPASRQQLSLKSERLLMYQISISDIQERVGYSVVCYVAIQSTTTKISSAKGYGRRLVISHRADSLQHLSNTTLSDLHRGTPLSSFRLTTYGYCAPSLYT
jgi:hypothetical protein